MTIEEEHHHRIHLELIKILRENKGISLSPSTIRKIDSLRHYKIVSSLYLERECLEETQASTNKIGE